MCIRDRTANLDHYEMGLAAAKINSFIWDVYCDWFIEIAKPRLNSGDAEQMYTNWASDPEVTLSLIHI